MGISNKIFRNFEKGVKDGSFQEWLKENPDPDPKVNEALDKMSDEVKGDRPWWMAFTKR